MQKTLVTQTGVGLVAVMSRFTAIGDFGGIKWACGVISLAAGCSLKLSRSAVPTCRAQLAMRAVCACNWCSGMYAHIREENTGRSSAEFL